ncbi:hypothetical protein FDT66_02505 [Polaribacter aestuariivivens]|uniref:Uncharacterized protein n=1 Tax=Polaribacter aestuariivivens TaxID=2304626 RepID=A0A5S3NFN0_9FLAO|nr:hypothetical protein [Polaribacter aestuariivivens]TMM32356.1 hypothetical protein FDT66_02505 [Polaribacter aestuariivivens]
MHKKLESDLISLAHSILQMKNKDNVFLLKQKSKEIYEKLAVLAFVEEYVNSTSNIQETKEELITTVEKAFEKKKKIEEKTKEVEQEKKVVHNLEDDYLNVENEKLAAEVGGVLSEEIENEIEENIKIEDKEAADNEIAKEARIEQPFEDLEGLIFGDVKPQKFKDDPKDVGKVPTLEDELEDTIPVDVMANLFEPIKPKSLNDKLQTNINIGLNDRIAFVKNLFDGSQEDFNRVVSQLNTLKTEQEAKKFVNKMVKPDYKWDKHEELEARFMEIIERRFA